MDEDGKTEQSIEDVIAKWRVNSPRKKRIGPGRSEVQREVQGRVFLAASMKFLIVFLVLSTVPFHFPPAGIGSLPHADVLIVDMTGHANDSREPLYSMFQAAGLSWVKYDGMSVEGLRLLPTGGYRFVILWGHSGIDNMATTQPYSPFYHLIDQLTDQLGRHIVAGKEYFAIQPRFVEWMKGSFSGTVVMLMGCNTLTQTELAGAFLKKGASTVIGWTGLVTLSVTDMTVFTLFQKVIQEHKSPNLAVSETDDFLTSMGMSSGLSLLAR